jgi:hypothetical protein
MILMRVRGHVEDNLMSLTLRRCSIGDWFVLYQLGGNVNPFFFRDVIAKVEARTFRSFLQF